MTEPAHSQSDWQSCPAGELVSLRNELKEQTARASRQQLSQIAGMVGLVLVAIGFAWWSLQLSNVAGIACPECQQHFASLNEALLAGDSERLAADELTAAHGHLVECQDCQNAFAQEFPDAADVVRRAGETSALTWWTVPYAFAVPLTLIGIR